MVILRWIGQRATAALAIGGILGLFIPGVQSVAQDALPILIFVFTVASFLKVDAASLASLRHHPVRVGLLLGWCLLLVPVIVQVSLVWSYLPDALREAVLIWAVSPPMAAAIVFAVFLRLDVALAATASVAGMLLLPITGSPSLLALADLSVGISPATLIVRVGLFIGSAALVAFAIRKAAGLQRIERYSHEISGVTVIILVVYATSLISAVRDYIFAHPWQALGFVGLAALLNAGIQILTALVFWRAGPMFATTGALLTGNKNMSVIYANLGAVPTPEITLFFAAIHVPIYTFPWLFGVVYRAAASGSLWTAVPSPAALAKAPPPRRQRSPGLQRGR